MFQGEMDTHNAFVEVQSGSGGTEAQDWSEMLLRMYLRWGEKQGFKTQITELSPGEVAGIKSATVQVSGEYAFGWLRTETGVHRLVRKSPFDSGNRRHTSFASVFVSPEIDDDIEIDINPAEVRVDTYRASGAGGQHVNRTDSAVRLTHLPTNTVVQCQSERSQHQNKDRAYKQLRAKLYELRMLQRRAEQQAMEDAKADIGWGSQIRSYVLDQSRVKDLRTVVERSDPGACSTATSRPSWRPASRRDCEVSEASGTPERDECAKPVGNATIKLAGGGERLRQRLPSQCHLRGASRGVRAIGIGRSSPTTRWPPPFAGRVMLRRVMGKASFITLEDGGGRIQCYLSRDVLGAEAYQAFKSGPLGYRRHRRRARALDEDQQAAS